jgi:hypothetical protein
LLVYWILTTSFVSILYHSAVFEATILGLNRQPGQAGGANGA